MGKIRSRHLWLQRRKHVVQHCDEQESLLLPCPDKFFLGELLAELHLVSQDLASSRDLFFSDYITSMLGDAE